MPPDLDYHSASTPRDPEGTIYLILLRSISAYFLLSSLTIPFMNAIWIGELPVIALVQVPKTEIANRIRHLMSMQLLGPLGLSRGSYSPDWMLARPWALAVVYL